MTPQMAQQQSQPFGLDSWLLPHATALCECVHEGVCFKYESVYFSPYEQCQLTKWPGLNDYNKIKTNKNKLMGWDERYCISSVKDKHIMHSMTQKNILQHLGLFFTSKCQESWKKERSSLRLSQPEEAPSHALNAFGNKHRQGKVISLWLSSASGLEDMKLSHTIINTPATCTRWDYWRQWECPQHSGGTPSNSLGIRPHYHAPYTSL